MPENNTTTATQDQIIGAIRGSQDATVNALRSWAKTFTMMTPNVFDAYPPKFDNMFGYTDKLWAIQRDFSLKLFEGASELGRTMADTAKGAAENVKAATATATKP